MMKLISLLMVFLQLAQWNAFGSTAVGIARIGDYKAQDERAYAILEKRVQRWVENGNGLGLEAKTFQKAIRQEDLMGEIHHLQLEKNVLELQSELRKQPDLKKLQAKIQKIKDLRRGVELNPDFSPAVQKSLVVEALYDWMRKDKRGAASNLHRAAKLHPEASIPSLVSWDRLESENALIGFDILVDQAVNAQTRGCRILIKTDSPLRTSEVYANGFRLGAKKELHLNSGMLYRISKGPEFEQTLVRCERQSNQKIVLPSRKVPASRATLVLAKEGVASAFLIESDKADFKLNLFTPGLGFDEVPLERALKKSEILQNPTEEGLPIAKHTFSRMLETHRLSSLKMKSLLPVGHPSPMMVSHLDHRVEESHKWYNHWAFWAITGAVVAGASVAFFASRNNDSAVGVTKSQISARFE